MIALSDLGPRICIIGPSSSGKSTLAQTLGQAWSARVVHLDQLHHLPNTQWQPRPQAEFVSLHDEAIGWERWVVEGNYFRTMPQRFERATAIIWLDPPPFSCLWRWVRRMLQSRKTRIGMLDGAEDRLSCAMARYILWQYPNGRNRYADILARQGVPVLHLKSMGALRRHLKHWGLQQKKPGRDIGRRG